MHAPLPCGTRTGYRVFLVLFHQGHIGQCPGHQWHVSLSEFWNYNNVQLRFKHSGSFNFHSICPITRLRICFWTTPLYFLLVIRLTLFLGGRVCVSTMWRIRFYYLTSLSKVWLPFFRDVRQGAWLCSLCLHNSTEELLPIKYWR